MELRYAPRNGLRGLTGQFTLPCVLQSVPMPSGSIVLDYLHFTPSFLHVLLLGNLKLASQLISQGFRWSPTTFRTITITKHVCSEAIHVYPSILAQSSQAGWFRAVEHRCQPAVAASGKIHHYRSSEWHMAAPRRVIRPCTRPGCRRAPSPCCACNQRTAPRS